MFPPFRNLTRERKVARLAGGIGLVSGLAILPIKLVAGIVLAAVGMIVLVAEGSRPSDVIEDEGARLHKKVTGPHLKSRAGNGRGQ
jgi:membrane-bound ClpP family serine protease